MKKLALKVLSIVGASLTLAGGGYGLLMLFGKILAGKLTDEYIDAHPVKGWFYCIGGLLIIVVVPFYVLWNVVWGISEKIEKKIDEMRDKHIDISEDEEWKG